MKLLTGITFILLLTISSINALVLPLEQLLNSTKSADLHAYLTQETLPVIIKFFSPYCAPCNALGPLFEEFSKQVYGSIICVEVNVITNKDEKTKFGITRWPTLLFYEDGIELNRKSGTNLTLTKLKQIAVDTFKLQK